MRLKDGGTEGTTSAEVGGLAMVQRCNPGRVMGSLVPPAVRRGAGAT